MSTRIRRTLVAMAVIPMVAIALLTVPAQAQQDEGIKVHGHWVIEVRDADGSLDSRTEFDNALQYNGAVTLASILAGNTAPFYWAIVLGGAEPSCIRADKGEAVACVIGEPGNPSDSDNLTLQQLNNSEGFALSGSVTSTWFGRIEWVKTALSFIAEQPYSDIQGGGGLDAHDFTKATNDAQGNPLSIDVGQGQSIHVTVTISFS